MALPILGQADGTVDCNNVYAFGNFPNYVTSLFGCS